MQGFAPPTSAHPGQHPLGGAERPCPPHLRLQLTPTDSAKRLGCLRPSLGQGRSPSRTRQVWDRNRSGPRSGKETVQSPDTQRRGGLLRAQGFPAHQSPLQGQLGLGDDGQIFLGGPIRQESMALRGSVRNVVPPETWAPWALTPPQAFSAASEIPQAEATVPV